MTKKIFIVTVVVYDHYDDNLWSDARVFTDENAAKEWFKMQSEQCLADARDEDNCPDPDDWYTVDVEESENRAEYVRNDEFPLHSEVKIYQKEIALQAQDTKQPSNTAE